jgi:hypothetical protein
MINPTGGRNELGHAGQIQVGGGMGFRDLELFNMALLAKQRWRIIQQPESMLATILKEKYFWEATFMTASLEYNPSYAWRIIMKARGVLEMGLAWRVGNGESIRVWGDQWILGTSTRKVQTPILAGDPNMKVSEF